MEDDDVASALNAPGIQYVAVNAGGVISEHASGWADIRQRRPMALSTTLMAYSMTKTITAVAVLQLVEQGRVALDAPVARLLSESPYGAHVTVGELITHTGGIPNPIPLRWVHPVAGHSAFDERAALSDVLRAHPRLSREPGTRYAYSNIGYWMLGAIVERVAAMPFTRYVETHILTPLGATPDQLGFTVAVPERHATGYLERWSWANLLSRWLLDAELLGEYDGAWRRIGDHYPNGPAFGGLVGTARAFGLFLQDQLRAHSVLLNDRTRALLYTGQRTRTGRLTPMTFGWHAGGPDEAPFFFKEGGGGGFHCLMRISPRRGIGSVVMTNATGANVTSYLNDLDSTMAAMRA